MTLRAREGWVAVWTAAALCIAEDPRAQGWDVACDYWQAALQGDHVETVCAGAVRLVSGDLEIHAERGVLLADPDEVPDFDDGSDGLPRRGIISPSSRRDTSEAALRQRIEAFLGAVEGKRARALPETSFRLHMVQTVFVEGNVVVYQAGREVARGDSIHFSALDDRTVLRGAELRLWQDEPGKARVYVLRGEKLVRQGMRTTGRDVSLTTCNAGEPHTEVKLGEIELIQREADFEVRTYDGTLAFSGVGLVPIPNTSFFTRQQSNIPIKGASAGYSSIDGARAELVLGSSWNGIGGSLHELFTGRSPHEFRGDWQLGLGYNQRRGYPIEGDLVYEADGLYRGRSTAFFLDDRGDVRGHVTTRVDGSVIADDSRSMIHTENRFWLGEQTTLDLTAFDAGDPAVMPEFFPREYREDERPETSAHLRHWSENRLFTATVRGNAAKFSYADDRSLAPSFTQELPVATLHWFSEPIATLPTETPLLLTTATSAGYLTTKFDDRLRTPDNDATRLDQEIELAAPFWLGPVGFRPFTSARVTYYDQTAVRRDDTRWTFESGVEVGTRFARSWVSTDENGVRSGLRHVISPTIKYTDRYKVDGNVQDYYQFDATDALDERTAIRVGALNRVQRLDENEEVREFFWLDLGQTFTPLTERDNNGHHLGLLDYELIVFVPDEWSPVPNLRVLVEGEQDWHRGPQRTFNTGFRFGPVAEIDWHAEYRTDQNTDGTVLYGANTHLLGRWDLNASTQYDLGRTETLNYFAQLVRHDHDWSIHLGVVFDTVNNETRFFVNFLPTVGGLFKQRNRNYVSGGELDDV